MIRRIDFSNVVAENTDTRKKQKKSPKEAAPAPQQAWPWQSLVENLQLAHQELSIIIDLINTVLSLFPLFSECSCNVVFSMEKLFNIPISCLQRIVLQFICSCLLTPLASLRVSMRYLLIKINLKLLLLLYVTWTRKSKNTLSIHKLL